MNLFQMSSWYHWLPAEIQALEIFLDVGGLHRKKEKLYNKSSDMHNNAHKSTLTIKETPSLSTEILFLSHLRRTSASLSHCTFLIKDINELRRIQSCFSKVYLTGIRP